MVPRITEDFGELRAADGVRLAHRSWPVAAPRAALLVSHGLGEHAGRYARLARALNEHGIAVHALDHRGHGRSGGWRGHIGRFSTFVADLERFREVVAGSYPDGLPIFLLGHSLGGLIAIRHLQAHPEAPYRGAILSAPLLGVAVQPARWKLALSGFFSRCVPWLPFSSEIDPAELSSDTTYQHSYREDPLIHARITPRLFTELSAAMSAAMAERDRLRAPLLFLIPTGDRIVQPEAALRFAEGLPGAVEVRRYEGFRHEALNEAEWMRPVGDLRAWIASQGV